MFPVCTAQVGWEVIEGTGVGIEIILTLNET
jgi:hypothetical protein